ncbi:putative structural protein [Agrobacterium phage OLIVR2]|uniref:Putative structural protein n=1 Tax=Agrobacterium phage OLIVR1 TaxID=2723769 RepID=A0A858MXL7_9CAUD|nr:hypothetical protein [Xanthomonas campestris]YP_010107124.1 virion structural protein [Agrobacterium phage OLIVR1]QIW87392.1 putative structural protein [Agrobacterium phage OLIVR2]QIW87499.1 putative structural protein [Agrobacterium phage OLIVR3]MCF8861590.1 hypothetical protein [Xanthomonas campestris pv. campestris]QIW87285.1 putative structural protein [Agrobacterium phage OLIVR1]
MATSSGAGELANELLPELISGKDFSFPDINLNDPSFNIPEKDPNDPIWKDVTSLSNDDLTTRTVDGDGTFDVLMTSVKRHLKDEYSAGRITGNDYVKAYIELTASTMANATQFLLQKDQAFWQAIMIQQQAQRAMIETVIARVQLQTAKAQLALARTQAMTAEVEYALTKIKLSTEDATYANVLAQTEQTKYQTDELLPVQKLMVTEQMEAARAQTANQRTDGSEVEGSVGKQKDLYEQQIVSYKRDSEMKAAKLYTDAWITMKTIDEGLSPPNAFTNVKIDQVMNHIQANNGLV